MRQRPLVGVSLATPRRGQRRDLPRVRLLMSVDSEIGKRIEEAVRGAAKPSPRASAAGRCRRFARPALPAPACERQRALDPDPWGVHAGSQPASIRSFRLVRTMRNAGRPARSLGHQRLVVERRGGGRFKRRGHPPSSTTWSPTVGASAGELEGRRLVALP
jgi:hypothetical protein